jgi:aspartate aminotransferase-like enzyme
VAHRKARILVSPGPVEVKVLDRAIPSLHHRSDVFRGIVRETESMLRELLGTASPVYLMTASGTGAMEAAIVNATGEGERGLVVSGGKFADRWTELCLAYRRAPGVVRFPEGEAIDLDRVAERVRESRPRFVALTHVESSTGLLLQLRELLGRLPAERPLVIVDAISSLGVEDLDMDAWGIDVVVGGAQKAFAAPAGVSFVAMGERARMRMRKARAGAYYFDLDRYEAGREAGDLPFTPALQTIQIMHGSLSKMKALGFDAVRARHREASAAFLEAARHLSLECFPRAPSAAVQVLAPPKGCSADDVLASLERDGFVAAGGQGPLKGRVLRTGFLGLFATETLAGLVESLGRAVRARGGSVDPGKARDGIRALGKRSDLF